MASPVSTLAPVATSCPVLVAVCWRLGVGEDLATSLLIIPGVAAGEAPK